MPSTDTPTWWADVQQEREDLTGRGRRPADEWLDEDIDFVPRRRLPRSAAVALDATQATDLDGADHPLHGVFVPAASREVSAARPRSAARSETGRTIEIELTVGGGEEPAPVASAADAEDVAHELRHLHVADDPFAVPPPPPGTRRTVQIKGRPGEASVRSRAQRHRPRTTSDRVGHRPDRVALWAVLLGAILIILAAVSSSSQAATSPLVAPAAKVVHVAPAAAPGSSASRAVPTP